MEQYAIRLNADNERLRKQLTDAKEEIGKQSAVILTLHRQIDILKTKKKRKK